MTEKFYLQSRFYRIVPDFAELEADWSKLSVNDIQMERYPSYSSRRSLNKSPVIRINKKFGDTKKITEETRGRTRSRKGGVDKDNSNNHQSHLEVEETTYGMDTTALSIKSIPEELFLHQHVKKKKRHFYSRLKDSLFNKIYHHKEKGGICKKESKEPEALEEQIDEVPDKKLLHHGITVISGKPYYHYGAGSYVDANNVRFQISIPGDIKRLQINRKEVKYAQQLGYQKDHFVMKSEIERLISPESFFIPILQDPEELKVHRGEGLSTHSMNVDVESSSLNLSDCTNSHANSHSNGDELSLVSLPPSSTAASRSAVAPASPAPITTFPSPLTPLTPLTPLPTTAVAITTRTLLPPATAATQVDCSPSPSSSGEPSPCSSLCSSPCSITHSPEHLYRRPETA